MRRYALRAYINRERWNTTCGALYWARLILQEKLEMKNPLSRLWKDEDGQDLSEYALLVTLVALGSVAAMGNLSQAISKTFSSAAANMTT